MTRIFIYEYACAQSPEVLLPESVRVEGRAMLSALVEDFRALLDVEVLTLPCYATHEEQPAFQELAQRGDWSVVIAPELDGLLLERCRWVLAAGGRLLGPPPEAVELTGDKWATYQALRQHRIQTPWTWLSALPRARSASAGETAPALALWDTRRFVRKPRYGAGSQDTELVDVAEAKKPRPGFLVQEFVPGLAASVALLTGPNQVLPLLPAEQLLTDDGGFHYLGGRLPLTDELSARATRLAVAAIGVLPLPAGYLGVDVVLGKAADGSQDYLIEINPRMTTSYVGLRAAAADNLAELMLRIARGERGVRPTWREGSFEFAANGRLSS